MKYALLAAFIAFLLYWSAKGIIRRFRGEMPGRKPPKGKERQAPRTVRRAPEPEKPIRDVRYRDVK